MFWQVSLASYLERSKKSMYKNYSCRFLSIAFCVLMPMVGTAEEYPAWIQLPMEVGNHWNYVLAGDVEGKRVSVEIAGKYVADGVEWFHVEGLFDDFMMLRNSPDGVRYTTDCDYDNFYDCVAERTSPLVEYPLYQRNPSKGEQYGFLDWPDTAVTIIGETKVRVPAGTYMCTMYEFDIGGSVSRHCVADGVGIVLIEKTLYGDVPATLQLLP